LVKGQENLIKLFKNLPEIDIMEQMYLIHGW
jgi:hypothetical protein